MKKAKRKVQSLGRAAKPHISSGVPDDLLHKVVAQNKYDIAPYVKYGKSRNKKGRSK